jgi:hypothetical protein
VNEPVDLWEEFSKAIAVKNSLLALGSLRVSRCPPKLLMPGTAVRGGWLVQEARQATQLLFMGSFLAGQTALKTCRYC